MARKRSVALRVWIVIVAAVVVAACLSAPGALGSRGIPPSAEAKNVVIVVFDEFPLASLLGRVGKVDARLFPNFAQLTERSTWFRNATTVAGFTSRALPAILTGRYPTRSILTLGGTAGANLFTLLEPSHEVRSPDVFPGLCPAKLCRLRSWKGGTAPALSGPFIDGPRGTSLGPFLEMLGKDGPCLCVFHPVVPHSPWRYLPTGQRYPGTKPIPGQVEMAGPGRAWGDDPWLVTQAYQRHLLQASFADKILGTIVAELRRQGIFDESALVIAADHGVAFRAGEPKRDITATNVGDVAAVPLFIKAPGQTRGVVSDLPVETVDIVPTLLDLLGVQGLDPILDGTSLWAEGVPARKVRVIKPVQLPDEGVWQASVRHKFKVFSGDSSPEIFGVAPEGTEHLLGAPAPVESPASPRYVEVPDLEGYETAQADAADLPALLRGSLRGPGDDSATPIAIAVNGRIVAITRTYETDGELRFYAMLPPRIFKTEARAFTFYEVAEDGPMLLPTGLEIDRPFEVEHRSP